MAKNIIYFDLETQKSADEVGGWGNISKMGMSIGVTCSSANGEYKIYGEKQVDELIKDLQRADLVVGFNNLRFDYEVLHGYTSFDLSPLTTLDMMVVLQKTLNHRLSLDSIATATFPAWKKRRKTCRSDPLVQGRPGSAEIAEYCLLRREDHEARPRIRDDRQHRQLHYANRFGKKMNRAGGLVNFKLSDQGRANDAGGIAELIFHDGRFQRIAENKLGDLRDAFRVERVEF